MIDGYHTAPHSWRLHSRARTSPSETADPKPGTDPRSLTHRRGWSGVECGATKERTPWAFAAAASRLASRKLPETFCPSRIRSATVSWSRHTRQPGQPPGQRRSEMRRFVRGGRDTGGRGAEGGLGKRQFWVFVFLVEEIRQPRRLPQLPFVGPSVRSPVRPAPWLSSEYDLPWFARSFAPSPSVSQLPGWLSRYLPVLTVYARKSAASTYIHTTGTRARGKVKVPAYIRLKHGVSPASSAK